MYNCTPVFIIINSKSWLKLEEPKVFRCFKKWIKMPSVFFAHSRDIHAHWGAILLLHVKTQYRVP